MKKLYAILTALFCALFVSLQPIVANNTHGFNTKQIDLYSTRTATTLNDDQDTVCGTIAELRSKMDFSNSEVYEFGNIEYYFTGDVVVTAKPADNNYIIQDSTAAILIYDSNSMMRMIEVGDKIRGLKGTLINNHGFLEFCPTHSYEQLVGYFEMVTPLVITLEQLNDTSFMSQHQAELIQLQNVVFTSTGNFSVLNRYDLYQNGTTAPALYTYFERNYMGDYTIPTGFQNITGFNYATRKIGQNIYDFRYYIVPRDFYDIVPSTTCNFPTVSTPAVTNITSTSANCNGEVTLADDNCVDVIFYGICWSTMGMPTIEDEHNIVGEGTGEFVSAITGLTPGTAYFVRAYAITDAGTVYSDMTTFLTLTEIPETCNVITVLPFIEDFEDELDECWTSIDNDMDSYNWYSTIGTNRSAHNGIGAYASDSYNNGALTPNNWLITPAIAIPAEGAKLNWWVAAHEQSWPAEHYQVMISTTESNPSEFTVIYEETLARAEWIYRTILLSEYANQNIYIAFVHNNCTDMYSLLLDDIAVKAMQTTAPIIEVEPNTVDFGTKTYPHSTQATVFVSSYNTDDDINISTTAPFAVSTDGLNFSSTATLSQNDGTLYIQYAPTYAGSHNGIVSLSCDTTIVNIELMGNTICALPDVITADVTNISLTTANCGGRVSSDNCTDVTAYGVCWNTTGEPTIEDAHTIDGEGTGEFSSNITGLEPGTTYYIRAYATNETGTAYGYINNFSTECISFSAPFLEDFSESGYTQPTCWHQYSGLASEIFSGATLTLNSSRGWIFYNDHVFPVGHPAINIYGSYCNYWLVSPAIDLSGLTTPALIFDLALTQYNSSNPISDPSSQNDDQFMVLVSTDGGASWSADNAIIWNNQDDGDHVFNLISSTGEEIIIPLTQYAGQTIRIAFYGESTISNSDNDLHINYVAVDEQPVCIAPAQLHVTNLGTSSAEILWTENGNATSWIIEYDTTGFEHGTGHTCTVTETPTVTILGLESNTIYDVYVKAVCNDGSFSNYSYKSVFTTLPGEPATTPYAHDFENEEENNAWVLINGTQTNKWYIGQPDNENDNVLFISNNGTSETYDPSSSSNVWAFRDIAFGEGAEFTLDIKWKANGEYYFDYIQVLMGSPVIRADNNTLPSNATILASELNQQSEWQHFTQTLDSSYANTTQRLYILWKNDSWIGANPAAVIDSISIKVFNCISPSDISFVESTTSSITLTWTERGQVSAWDILYGPVGFDPANDGELITGISTNPYVITGLTNNMSYDIYVRANCDGDVSRWMEFSAHTACDLVITDFPFIDNFGESSTTRYCWTIIDANNDGNTFSLNDDNISYHWSYTNPANDWLISPVIQLGDNTVSSFDYKVIYGNYYHESFSVYVIAAGQTHENAIQVLPTQTISNSSWETQYINLSAYANQNIQVAIKCESEAGQDIFAITNFHIGEEIPTTMETDVHNIDFGIIPVGNTQSAPVIISSMNLNETITVETTAPYGISLDGTTFSSSLTIPANADISVAETIYVQFAPTAIDTFNDIVVIRTSNISDTIALTGICIPCNIITDFPFIENFEETSPTRSCWTITDANNDGYLFSFYDGSARYRWNTYSAADDWLISPEFELTGIQTVSFDYHVQTSYYPEKFQVYAINDNGHTALTDVITVSNTSFENLSIDISNLIGIFKIGIHCVSDENMFCFHIDNFVINNIENPVCRPPYELNVSHVTSNEAIITWTPRGNETSWIVNYKPDTASQWQETICSVPNFNLAALTPHSNYMVRAKSICGDNNESDWTDTLNFTTSCAATELPFIEDFEDELDGCWLNIDHDGNNHSWHIIPLSSHGGVRTCVSESYYYNYSYEGINNWLITPAITIPAEGAYLSWWCATEYRDNAGEHYQIMVSTTGTNPEEFSLVYEDTISNLEWSQRAIALSTYANQNIHIAFVHVNGRIDILKIDDIVVDVLPSEPIMEVESDTVDFGTIVYSDSAQASVNVFAYDLHEDISISTSEPFTVSTDGNNFNTTATIPVNSLFTQGTLYIRYNPTNTGSHNGILTLTCDTITATVSLFGNANCNNPNVYISAITDITFTSAICESWVEPNICTENNIHGVCWSTSMFPSIDDAHTVDGEGTGIYSSLITGLTPNTTYFVCAYATNEVGTSYSNVWNFTTPYQPTGTHNVEADTACGSYEWHGQLYTETGVYAYEYINNDNCASSDTLYLTVNHGTHNVKADTACGSYEWHGQLYTETGVYAYEYINNNDCASADTLYLTVNHGTHTVETDTACESYEWHGQLYTETGVYAYEYFNNDNCASADTLYLTVNHGTHNVEDDTACESYEWHGQLYTETGVYAYEYINNENCASADTLYLTVNQSIATDEYLTICESELPYTYGDTVFDVGTPELSVFSFQFSTQEGCDSIVTLHLTIINCCQAVTNLAVDSVSENSVSLSWDGDASNYTIMNGTTMAATGITSTHYTVTGLMAATNYIFSVIANCSATNNSDPVTISATTSDSASIAINLTVVPSNPTMCLYVMGSGSYHVGDTAILTAVANSGFYFVNWESNGTTLSTDNPFFLPVTIDLPDTIYAIFDTTSCEPVINLEYIDTSATSVILIWSDPNNSDATYTVGYFDGTELSIVETGITDTFLNVTGLIPGTTYYFVVRTDCADSVFVYSDIITVTMPTVSIGTVDAPMKCLLYPNPANTVVTIEAEDMQFVTVFDATGREVLNRRVNHDIEYINVSNLNNGVYFFRIEGLNRVVVRKCVVSHKKFD